MPTARRSTTTRVRLIGHPAASTPYTPPPPRPVDVYRDGLTAAHDDAVGFYRACHALPHAPATTADTFRHVADDVARLAAFVASLDDGDRYGPARFLSSLADVATFLRYRADAAAGTVPPL